MDSIESQWRLKHSHESNLATYGTVGTAKYDADNRVWRFARDLFPSTSSSLDGAKDHENEIEEAPQIWTRRLNESPLTAVEQQRTLFSSHQALSIHASENSMKWSKKQYPELAAVPGSLLQEFKIEAYHHIQALSGAHFTFGKAIVVSEHGVDSGNHFLSASARVTGEAGNIVEVRNTSGRSVRYGDNADEQVACFEGAIATQWQSTLPVLQISYGGTYIAVRQRTNTHILQVTFSSPRERLQVRHLLSLPSSYTGGLDHADVAFDTSEPRKLAIIDVEGNWSIWKLRGRRHRTARQDYSLKLQSSGKIFSWTHRKRPKGCGLYFDGWHKVMFLASTSTRDDVMASTKQMCDRLLVCNRQKAQVFDLAGQTVCQVDARLDVARQQNFICDIRAGLSGTTFFILTTTRILLFDVSRSDWKDSGKQKSPLLICAWLHNAPTNDVNLKLTSCLVGQHALLGVFSERTTICRMWQLRREIADDESTVSTSDPWSISLPICDVERVQIEFVPVEYTGTAQQNRGVSLIEMVVVDDQNNIISTLFQYRPRRKVDETGVKPSTLLSLTRRQGGFRSHFKSSKYVYQADEVDADLDQFVVSDTECDQPVSDIDMQMLIDKPKTVFKDYSRILAYLESDQADSDDAMKNNASIVQTIQDAMQIFEDNQSPARTLLDLVQDARSVEDIEDESEELQHFVEQFDVQYEQLKLKCISTEPDQALLELYDTLFATHVSSLPDAFSARVRHRREKLVRRVAVERYLSNFMIVRRAPILDIQKQFESLENETSINNDQLILSDRLIHSEPLASRGSYKATDIRQATSTSQPSPRSASTDPHFRSRFGASQASTNTTVQDSPLTSALSRLSLLAHIPHLTNTIMTETQSKNLTSILSHIPVDLADPDTYDWSAAERASAASNSNLTATAQTPLQKRQARKLEKARERAAHVSHLRKVNTANPNLDLSLGVSGISLSSPVGRTYTESQPGFTNMGLSRRSEQRGQTRADNSSPMPMQGVTMTQPERGAFAAGARKVMKANGKKKKRVAGF